MKIILILFGADFEGECGGNCILYMVREGYLWQNDILAEDGWFWREMDDFAEEDVHKEWFLYKYRAKDRMIYLFLGVTAKGNLDFKWGVAGS